MVPNQKKIERYVSLEGGNPSALAASVEQHIKKGFQPWGTVLLFGNKLYQVMVVYKRTIGLFAVVDEDANTSVFDEEDGGEGIPTKLCDDTEPFIIKNVTGNWSREVLRSESPFVVPNTPITIHDQYGNSLLVTSVSSVKGASLVVSTESPSASITVNTAPFNTAPSGGGLNVPVVSEDLTNAGTIVAGKVVIANTDVSINAVPVDSLQAEDLYDLTVTLGGNPTTPTYSIGTRTIDVTPITDLLIRIFIADTDTDAGQIIIDANSAGSITSVNSGGLTNLVIEVNGNPVTAPFTLAIADTLDLSFDSASGDTAITLTGTY